MTWLRGIDTARAWCSVAIDLSLCGIKARGVRVSFHEWQGPAGSAINQVSISIPSPNSDERLRFTGLSSTLTLSRKKAVGEYLEAIATYEFERPVEEGRSGWATAESSTLARQRAYEELIERDAFIMHLHCPALQTRKIDGKWDRIGIAVTELQTADPATRVCLAGTKTGQHWILGLGACAKIQDAAHKAALEVAMLFRSWDPIGVSTLNQRGPIDLLSRADILRCHWDSAASHEVQTRLQLIFKSAGTESHTFKADQSLCQVLCEKRFSGRHFTVKLQHPDLLPLTFGKLWIESEISVLSQLRARGLQPQSFVVHPLL